MFYIGKIKNNYLLFRMSKVCFVLLLGLFEKIKRIILSFLPKSHISPFISVSVIFRPWQTSSLRNFKVTFQTVWTIFCLPKRSFLKRHFFSGFSKFYDGNVRQSLSITLIEINVEIRPYKKNVKIIVFISSNYIFFGPLTIKIFM